MSDWITAHLETERLEQERRRDVRRYGDEICQAILDGLNEALGIYSEAHPDSCPAASAEASDEGWTIAVDGDGEARVRILFVPAEGRLVVERGGTVDVEVAMDRRRAPLAQSIHRVVYFRYNGHDWGLEDFIRLVLEPYLFTREIVEKTSLRHPALIDVYKHVYEDVLRGRR